MFVHRLIARAFVPGYSPELSVNHMNGNKLDNRPENLEWMTLAENSAHAWKTGLVNLRGENTPSHKLTQRQVIHIRRALRLGVPANSLAIIANVNASTVYQIEWGKRWNHITDDPTSC
jgi:elongation factor P hydroxylase